MATTNLYLKRPGKSGESLIVLSFSYHNRRLILSTGERIHPDKWNKRSEEMKRSFTGSMEFNQLLRKFRERVEKTYLVLSESGRIPEPEEIRDLINEERKPKTDIQKLIPAFEEFIREHRSIKQPNTLRTYGTTLNHLKEFQTYTGRTLKFSSVDETLYIRFTSYLQDVHKLALNSIGTAIKNLKTFLRYANRRGWIERDSFREFKVVEEETQTIYLTTDELQTLFNLDLSQNKALERDRDLFLIGCFTGLRFSDFTQLRPENIQGDRIHIRTEKTGDSVIIPLHPVVRFILNKYEMNLPRSISNQKLNKHLKEIGRLAGMDSKLMKSLTKGGRKVPEVLAKFELITTHTARRSFATNLYKGGFPSITLMKITGHKSESAFLKYIRIDKEEAANLLMNHWQNSDSTFFKIG